MVLTIALRPIFGVLLLIKIVSVALQLLIFWQGHDAHLRRAVGITWKLRFAILFSLLNRAGRPAWIAIVLRPELRTRRIVVDCFPASLRDPCFFELRRNVGVVGRP